MTDARQQDAESIFYDVVDLAPRNRAAVLDVRCGENTELRTEIESLLAHHDASATFLQNPVAVDILERATPAGAPPADRALPDNIGKFKILRLLGIGGMGVVYIAEQDNPRRQVALKVIRHGFDTRRTRKRFEFECQVLGKLHHPGIAQIFEAGVADTEQGQQPYFSMELIAGVSLSEYCKTHSLGMRERLHLISLVCDAVQHAHQHGIIHRDLKPANVLVDSTGQPKVLDFGIAKAAELDLQETTQYTATGELIGTLAYMSPEQLSQDTMQLDTRSDVYALGVICFQLLTSDLPYDLSGKSLPAASRMIDEIEPVRLGTVNRILRGDVETIVAKALEKEKSRRYQSASEFAADIRRHLRHEPIVARPPTALYQVRMFAVRHKKAVTAAALVILSLIGGLVGMTWQAREAGRQRDEAARQARIATAVSDFLRRDLLSAVDPARTPDRKITVQEVLDEASEKIGDRFEDQPIVEASIRYTLGMTYDHLGEHKLAVDHIEAAFALFGAHRGEDHRDTLVTLDSLGLVYKNLGRYEESARRHLAALDQKRRVLGDDHFETAQSMNNLAAVYHAMGKLDDAQKLYIDALERYKALLGEDELRTLSVATNLANLYEVQGRYQKSEAVHREVLAIKRKLLGDDAPGTITSVDALAKVLVSKKELPEAEMLFREALDTRLRVLGEEHSDTLLSMNNLAVLCRERGMMDESLQLSAGVVEIQTRVLGATHPHTLVSRFNLAALYDRMEQDDKALAAFESVINSARESLSQGHWYLGVFLGKYGVCLARMGRHEDAIAALLESHEILAASLGVNHVRTQSTIAAISSAYESADRPEKAQQWRDRLEK